MAKLHSDRPSIYGKDFFHWIDKGIIKVKWVKRTPVYYLLEGKSVRQNWLCKKGKETIKHSEITYLRAGSFFVPRWMDVPAWEIEYYESLKLPLLAQGISHLEKRLCFMQVDDLSKLRRQQVHILDAYAKTDLSKFTNFDVFFKAMLRIETVGKQIELRKMGVDNLFTHVSLRVSELRRNLENLAKYAPIFKDPPEAERLRITLDYFKLKALECRHELVMKPIRIRTRIIARLLEIVILHIQSGNYQLARQCLQVAASRLRYPN